MSTAAAPRPPAAAWARGITGWHVAFWLLWALAVVAAVLWAPEQDVVGPRWASLSLLGVLGLAYAGLGGPAARRQGRAGARAYLAVVVVTLGVLFAVSPGLSFLLFLAFPQMWLLTGSRREGVAFTVALTLSAATGLAVRAGSWDGVSASFASLAVSLVFSLLLGLWISGIIEQSAQRADLIAQLEAAREDLARAHHDAGVVAERERLAREIHDTIAQGLTSVVMLSQVASRHLASGHAGDAARALATIEESARGNLADARSLVASYAAVGVDDGLPDALRRLGERFRRETGIHVDVVLPEPRMGDDSAGPGGAGGAADEAEVAGRAAPASGRAGEVVLLRAVQEGLANVRKHAAAAGRVTITLSEAGDGARTVEVRDDGAGFDPGRAAGGGFGLDGLARRAGEVGGEVAIDSSPGSGTVLRVAVPGE